MRQFEEGDHVITPSGEEARVVGLLEDGRLELRYLGALNAEHAGVVLCGKLLRKYVPGLRLPQPVRVRR